MIICYNCKQENPTRVGLVKCDEPGCEWSIYVCEACIKTRMGDGTQHAVIESRNHSAIHKPFLIVRLHPGSDNRGIDVGHVRDENELRKVIREDFERNGPGDFLVVEKLTKKNVRVRMGESDGKGGSPQSKVSTQSPEGASVANSNQGNGEPDAA